MGKRKEYARLMKLSAFMESHCDELQRQSRTGTANLCRSSYKRFFSFAKKRIQEGEDISSSLLRGYEEYLRGGCLSYNSVSTYLSNLRSLYNAAVSKGIISAGLNPFLHVRIRPVRTQKRSVPLRVIEEIAALVLEEESLILVRDLFLFCFLSSGIAFIDLAYLTTDNIKGGRLVFNRRKTGVRVSVAITPGMRMILQRYAGKGVGKYLFPILKSENASYQEYCSALRTYNRRLDKLSKRLTTPIKLTSYTARHTWATEAKRQQTPVALISEALGHTSEKTTLYYLDSLGESALDKANIRIIGPLEKLLVRQKKKCPLFMK